MASPHFTLNRRELITGLGAAALAPLYLAPDAAEASSSVALQARSTTLVLKPGAPPAAVWSLEGPDLAFKRGETAEIALANELPVPLALNWRGLDGVAAFSPLAARPPLAGGGKDALQLPMRYSGTFLCDPGLLGDGKAYPCRARALVVREAAPVAVDRDEVLLIEDWRVRPDGSVVAPGVAPGDAQPIHTINGRPSLDLSARVNERVRLRIISGCQRAVVAIKFEGVEVRVMAIDGQPAEPFAARGGALVLAPGARVDAFIDLAVAAGTVSQILLHDGKEARAIGRIAVSAEPPVRPAPLPPAPPLPSNGLPERVDLKAATRIDLPLGSAPGDWVPPVNFAVTAPPAFRIKAGRTAVLALTNRGATSTVFHLNGHHFRLLDKLDDGWKPFWLDTLAIEPGQTQRVAFVAEHAGRWLLEQAGTDWAAPRLVRWYAVE